MTIANFNDYRSAAARKLEPATDRPQSQAGNSVTAVPQETEARGFALYLGVDEATAKANGTSLAEIANALKQTFAELVPSAANQTYAAVALAPKGIGGRSVDVVRTALRDPRAIDSASTSNDEETGGKVTVDLRRKRVYRNGINAEFTNKEFLLLTHLIENEGTVISREELVTITQDETQDDLATVRTIDVHVRRLRAKITGFEDIIRTVRGQGYVYEEHPDVQIEN
jgi:DNA-binding winged helix-turn-helix (wHTH) protein